MVKEFEDPTDHALHLLFDATQVWGEGKDTTLEYAIKIVASVCNYARRNLVPVQVWGGGLENVGLPNGLSAQSEFFHRLALVTGGDGLALSHAIRLLPTGSSVLMAVSVADTESLQAATRLSPVLGPLVVVSLEGFGEPVGDIQALESISRSRIPVLPCRPGNLSGMFQSLESLGLPLLSNSNSSIVPGISP